MSVDYYRKQIQSLNVERERIIMEKGLAADANKDLRENAEYDYWSEKEIAITGRIGDLIIEIERLTKDGSKPKTTVKSKKSEKPVKKIKDLPKNRWL